MMNFRERRELGQRVLFHVYFLIFILFAWLEGGGGFMEKRYWVATALVMALVAFSMMVDNVLNYKEKTFGRGLGSVFLGIEIVYFISLVRVYLVG
jgi:hypothetical protein